MSFEWRQTKIVLIFAVTQKFSLFIAGYYLEIGFWMAFISIYMYGVHLAIYPVHSSHLHED